MRAGEIRGKHPHWERYFNGRADHEALQQIHGIGPARAALILRLYGSIDAFLQADLADIADRSRGLIGARFGAQLQQRCLDAGLRSDWSGLKEANRNTDAMMDAGASPWGQLAGVLARLSRGVIRTLRFEPATEP